MFADGPIDAKKLSSPYNSKTIGALADLFEKHPLNDDGGAAASESGSDSGESGSGFIESGSGMAESDTLKALVESVSDRVFYSKTARVVTFFYCVYTDLDNILMGPRFDLKFDALFYTILYFCLCVRFNF